MSRGTTNDQGPPTYSYSGQQTTPDAGQFGPPSQPYGAPYGGPPMPGAVPYYPQNAGYSQGPYNAPYPPQQQQQQQQQTTVVMGGVPAPTYVTVRSQSFCGHIALACVVLWCCGFLFGLIAFILAMVASSSAADGDENTARQLGRASLGVSITGIILPAVITAIVVGVIVGGATSSCYDYSYNYYYTC